MKKTFFIPIFIIAAFFIWSPKANAATNIAVSSAKYTSSSTILVTFTATGSNLTTSTAALWHVGDAGLTPASSTISSATSTQTITLIFSGTPFSNTGTSSTAAHGLYADGLAVTDAEGDTNTVLILGTSKAVSDSQLPTLSAVTIASNNANAAKAKVGDVVTITFSASEKLNTNTVSATSTSGTTLNWMERATSTNPAVDAGWVCTASDADGSNLIAGGFLVGLYTSSDYGMSWTKRQPGGTDGVRWYSLASDSDGSHLIAGDNGNRLYTSSDYGVTWTERMPTGVAENKDWLAVASSADGSHLVAAVWGGRIYTSSDYGVTWTETTPTGVGENKNWRVASDSDGSNLIVGAFGGRLYTSADYGASWAERAVTSTASNASWYSVTSDADGSNLVAVVYGGRVYTSADSGVTWTERQPAGDVNRNWYNVASDSDGSNLVVGSSGSGGRLYTSSNSGITWTEQYPPGGTTADKNWYAAFSDADGSNLIAAANNGRFYTSSYTHLLNNVATSTSDGGTTWTATTTVTWVDTEGAIGFDILFSDVAGNAGEGVYATTDSSSVTFDKTAPTLSAVTIVSNNSNTSYAKVGGTVTLSFTASEALSTTGTLSVAFSSGATLTWTERYPPGGTASDQYWRVASDADGSNLIAGAYLGGRLYTSSNYGVTWTERRPTGIDEDKSWFGIASDADGSSLIAGADSSRLYISSDGGVTWTERRPTGSAEDKRWVGVASDADGSNLVVSAYGGRLYTSADGGVTWTERRPSGSDVNKNWYAVASDTDGSNLIVGIDALDRLYTSSDYGVTWTERRPTGIDEDKQWTQISSDADGSNLIVSGYNGRLYISIDSGATWTERYPPGGTAANQNSRVASDADGSNLAVGVKNNRFYISTDSGANWTESAVTSTAANAPWLSAVSDYDGSNLMAVVLNGRLYTSSYNAVAATVATSTSDHGTTWTATYTANAADVQGPVKFAINFQDLAGNVTVVSDTTNSSSVTLDGPLAPTGLAVLGGGLGRADLSWSATSGATSYKIYRSTTDSGFTTSIGTSAVTSYADESVSPGGTYYYKISAVNVTGEGPQSSSSVSITTQNLPTGGGSAPAPVTPVTPPITPPAVITSLPATDPNATGAYSPSSATESTPSLKFDLSIVQSIVTSTLCIPETLIKSVSNSSVYYCGGDGLRYVFANEAIYFSWFTDFLDVKVLTDAELAQIPLGHKLITHRPGVKMIKIQTDPKVYAVARGGILRWIKNEAMAKLLYGDAWNTKILDVSDALFTSYTIGEPIQ